MKFRRPKQVDLHEEKHKGNRTAQEPAFCSDWHEAYSSSFWQSKTPFFHNFPQSVWFARLKRRGADAYFLLRFPRRAAQTRGELTIPRELL